MEKVDFWEMTTAARAFVVHLLELFIYGSNSKKRQYMWEPLVIYMNYLSMHILYWRVYMYHWIHILQEVKVNVINFYGLSCVCSGWPIQIKKGSWFWVNIFKNVPTDKSAYNSLRYGFTKLETPVPAITLNNATWATVSILGWMRVTIRGLDVDAVAAISVKYMKRRYGAPRGPLMLC